MVSAFDSQAKGTGFESHCGQEFLILYFSIRVPHSSSKTSQMKSTMTYSELIPGFRSRFATKIIDDVSSGISLFMYVLKDTLDLRLNLVSCYLCTLNVPFPPLVRITGLLYHNSTSSNKITTIYICVFHTRNL